MSNATALAERYIAVWNETDAGRRRALIAKTWTEGARYVDPMMNSEGHAGIDAMIAGVQSKYPGLTFSLAGKVDEPDVAGQSATGVVALVGALVTETAELPAVEHGQRFRFAGIDGDRHRQFEGHGGLHAFGPATGPLPRRGPKLA